LDGPVPPEIGRRYLIGLDVGVVHDRTVAAVCHVERTDEEGRRVVLDRLQAWAGTRAKPVQLQEVAEWVALVSAEYKQATVIYDPHQAVLLAQQLARRGVHVRRFDFTSTSVGRLALSLYRALRERQLALPDDPELLDELANVRIVERSPGQYRIDHDPDRHDDRAIALALCVHDLLDRRRPSSDGWSLLDERRGLRDLADPMRQILRLREHSGTVKYNQSF
jgi:phage FluMu gp28-like protein